MLLAAKLAGLLALMLWGGFASAKDIYILVIGEAGSANCNAHRFTKAVGVYQIGLDGAVKPAHDPFEWADCKGGSIWIPLGKQIINAGMADRVIFMPIGLARMRARDWLADGRAVSKLSSVTNLVVGRKIRFDYALWQQGYSDRGSSGPQYISDLSKVIKNVSLNMQITKWIIAQSAGCGAAVSTHIKVAQSQIALNPLFNRFLGPDISSLSSAYRSTECNFNEIGQQKVAQLWFRSMQEADTANVRYQKESLLYYFK